MTETLPEARSRFDLAREPAVLLALISAALQVISTFIFNLTDEQQGLINAAVALILGGVTAAMVSVDALLPLLAGIVQAVLNVAVAFGLELSADQMTVIMAFVAAVVGLFVRSQVTPMVAAKQDFRLAA
jgi:nicotinamide riboside transporter PnuC